jgi:hypothetical protein
MKKKNLIKIIIDAEKGELVKLKQRVERNEDKEVAHRYGIHVAMNALIKERNIIDKDQESNETVDVVVTIGDGKPTVAAFYVTEIAAKYLDKLISEGKTAYMCANIRISSELSVEEKYALWDAQVRDLNENVTVADLTLLEPLLRQAVEELNAKGFVTRSSCQGHPERKAAPWLAYDDNPLLNKFFKEHGWKVFIHFIKKSGKYVMGAYYEKGPLTNEDLKALWQTVYEFAKNATSLKGAVLSLKQEADAIMKRITETTQNGKIPEITADELAKLKESIYVQKQKKVKDTATQVQNVVKGKRGRKPRALTEAQANPIVTMKELQESMRVKGAPEKKKRGRPRKEETIGTFGPGLKEQVKKKRGRPRKGEIRIRSYELEPFPTSKKFAAELVAEMLNEPKKKRGRPRKEPVATNETSVKRKRGRPRKK